MASKNKNQSAKKVLSSQSVAAAQDAQPKTIEPKKLVNPVLVSVGKPALPHQTPVYPWMVESDEGKALLRQDSPEMVLNFTGKNSALLQSMYEYSIVPTEKIKKRMDFFYTPYNQQFLLRKHMVFDDEEKEKWLK